jgi:hypothetical protein
MEGSQSHKRKSFWRKPEGITGAIFGIAIVLGGGLLLYNLLPILVGAMSSVLSMTLMLLVLGVLIYMVLDPKMRNLVWYMYKSVMRWVTGLFVQIDPIGVLKNYVDDLKDNLKKMSKQITKLRGQMHKLKEQIVNNQKAIQSNLEMASKAKEIKKRDVMILKSRKAGRLKESNMKLEDLYKKMEILHRVLRRMFENSSIMMEDITDQVKVKEQERLAIRASHGAMKSAMNIIRGDKDKKYMFDQALEAITDDVSQKVGEMERFMEVSEGFMNSVDLQNGIFEEEGLKMLEKWEKEGESLILGGEKEMLILQADDNGEVLDLESPVKRPIRATGHKNQYDDFFN